jgi:hypothetical protein
MRRVTFEIIEIFLLARAEMLREFVERSDLISHELEIFSCPSLEEHKCIGIKSKSIGSRFDTNAIDHDELQRSC